MHHGQRSSPLSDIPTFEEQGYPGLDIQAWTGILAPRNMSRDMVKATANAVSRVLQRDDVRAKLLAGGMTPWVLTAEDFGRTIRDESDRYRKIIIDRNIVGE